MSPKLKGKDGYKKRGRPKGLSSKWSYYLSIAIPQIFKEYKGLPLTIRQIFYRLVAKYKMKKSEYNYKYLCKQMVIHRKNKWFDWKRIVDLTRRVTQKEWITDFKITPKNWWENYVKEFVKDLRRFHVPFYKNQDFLIEIWAEHEGLQPLFKKALKGHYITLYFTRGRNSWSNWYEASERLKDVKRKIVILHFADYDKYGLEMTQDIINDLKGFFKLDIEVKRVAITKQQMTEWNLVDTQLEAIDPSKLMQLIQDSIKPYIDEKKLKEVWEEIHRGKEVIEGWIGNFKDWLKDEGYFELK